MSGRRSIRLVVAALMAAGLVAAAPGVAQAKALTDDDAAKDVVKAESEEGSFTPVPRRRLNDVMSTKLSHTSDKVAVRMEVAELTKTDALRWLVSIFPSKGDARAVTLDAQDGSWSGRLSVVDPETDESVDCGNHTIDYKADVVRISLPRDCVGKGRWVRFQVGALTATEDAMYGDDAILDRPIEDGTSEWTSSARVYK